MLKKILLLALLPAIAFAEELPAPVKAIEKQGITIIKTFDAPGGMKGYLGKYQDMGVTIYLTPDGKHAISGYMYNEKGENLSNTLIEKEIYAPAGREMWQRMEQSHWLLDGKKDAPVIVYVPANVSTEQMKVLSDNEKLMDDLGANVTPAIYYMSKENTLQQAVGLPDQKTLNIIMGNK